MRFSQKYGRRFQFFNPGVPDFIKCLVNFALNAVVIGNGFAQGLQIVMKIINGIAFIITGILQPDFGIFPPSSIAQITAADK